VDEADRDAQPAQMIVMQKIVQIDRMAQRDRNSKRTAAGREPDQPLFSSLHVRAALHLGAIGVIDCLDVLRLPIATATATKRSPPLPSARNSRYSPPLHEFGQ